MTRPRPGVFTVWQSRVDAPHFPRDVAWWQGFIPSTWVRVTADVNPDAIVLTTDNAQALGRWLSTCAGGRLSRAFEEGAKS